MLLLIFVDETYVYHSLLFQAKPKFIYIKIKKKIILDIPQEIHVYQPIDYLYIKEISSLFPPGTSCDYCF
jgi:hypothetical protein